MTVLKTETETAVFSHNTDRNRPSSDDPQPLQHYCIDIYQAFTATLEFFDL